AGGGGYDVGQQFERVGGHVHGQGGHAGEVAARSVEASDKSKLDRVVCYLKHDRNGRRRRLRGQCRRNAGGHNHRYLTPNEIGGQRRQSIVLIVSPAVLDRDVLAGDKSGFFQGLDERGYHGVVTSGRRVPKEPDARHRRLLRMRRDRPRNRPTTEQHDEVAPPHSITSSARPDNGSGTVMLSALAVFRLMYSSNLLAC